MLPSLTHYLNSPIKAAPLAVFRILFGVLMVISMIRFWYHGWIEKLYLTPQFHFHFYGFEFIQVPGQYTYLLFILCTISALAVALGYRYRLAICLFFLCFTYIELMDKTTYLNHYYFISVVSFILIWLPANAYFSIDAQRNSHIASKNIPRWSLLVLQMMIAIVYLYAGLAKLNDDWMYHAMPLAIWLPSKFDMPLIGHLMEEPWMHYLFSWGGALYDLSIVPLLLIKRTRLFAFSLVILFHVLTRVLFPIGMFPYIMIASSLLFFSATFHEKILGILRGLLGKSVTSNDTNMVADRTYFKWSRPILVATLCLQLLIPWRYILYPGNIFWSEEGYRFSWRVMLMEKTGYAQFKIVDGQSLKRFYVQNHDFLTPMQEKQMSTQPDFIIEYAHLLARHFRAQGHQNLEVYVDSFVSLNGRPSQPFISPAVDLLTLENDFRARTYVLPL